MLRFSRLGRHPAILPIFVAIVILAPMLPTVVCADNLGDYDEFYPNHARGHVDNVFDANGFDNVNLYNGNLTMSLPLGPPLHPAGDVTLQIALRYNSSIWADEDRNSGYFAGETYSHKQYGQGALLGTRYVGVGWSLHFGRIARRESGHIFVVTPDGGEHQLFSDRFGTYGFENTYTVCDPSVGSVCFTRDGSDLRATRTATGWKVESPGGLVSLYEAFLDQYTHTIPGERDFVGRDFARMRDGWYRTKIEDQWGNHIDITYATTGYQEAFAHGDGSEENEFPYNNWMTQLIPEKAEEYRADGTMLRYVTFVRETPGPVGSQVRPSRIKAVEFHKPNGTVFLQYDLSYLSYVDDDLQRLQLQSYIDFDSYPLIDVPDDAKLTDWVYFLEGASVSGSDIAYGFSYWTCATSPDPELEVGPACPANTPAEDTFEIIVDAGQPFRQQGQRRGVVREVDLPTGGSIDYEFGLWKLTHHNMHGTGINMDPECDIDYGGETPSDPANPCMDTSTHQLGVTERTVSDVGAVLARKSYGHVSGPALVLPVHFDSGNPTVWNPIWGTRDSAYDGEDAHLRKYLTSYAKTVVTNDFVVDEDGTDSGIGTNTRSDESVYHFSLGTTIIDHINDGDHGGTIQIGEAFTLPLTGALIYEQHYRGAASAGALERTVVHTYTVDDDAKGWAMLGPRYGSQVNRRPRETITYSHGAGSGGDDLVSVTRYGYEADMCTSANDPCPNLASAVGFENGFASHRTDVESQTTFQQWPDGFTEETMFAPLDAPSFDRHSETVYWKDALTGGDDEWMLNRVETGTTSFGGVAEAQESSTYTLAKGSLLTHRVHASPGSSGDDDIFTRLTYVNSNTDPGYGQARRRLMGLAGNMSGSDVNLMYPDSSEYFQYENGTRSKTWALCQENTASSTTYGDCTSAGLCEGWTGQKAGKPAQLQEVQTIDPGWRLPTSAKDANDNGIFLIEYDEIGRVTHIQPTSSALSETWLVYDAMKQTEVKVENSSGDEQVVARYDYDGLGRLTHEAKREVNTTGLEYDEEKFLHRNFRYDGLGTQWRVSNWKDQPDLSFDDLNGNIIKTVDPFGRTEKTKTSDGSVSEFIYSGARRTDARIKDPGGVVFRSRTVTDFDARGNVTRVLEEKDLATLAEDEDVEIPQTTDFVISSYLYDVGDRLTSSSVKGRDASKEEKTQNRTFTYDSRGFLIAETYPELGPGSIAYCLHDATGAAGRLAYGATGGQCVGASSPNGIIDSVRDAAGRHLQSWVKQGEKWYLSAETQYGQSAAANTIGRPIQADQYTMVTSTLADPVTAKGCVEPSAVRVRHEYAYDHSQGLLDHRGTEVAFGADGTEDGFKPFDLGYDYDRWGNLSLIEYPRLDTANSCSPAYDVGFSYDPMGLLGVEEKDGETVLASLMSDIEYYLHTGWMKDWQTPSGVGGSVRVHHKMGPDFSRLRVRRIKAYPQDHSSVLLFSSGDYAYDGAGNVKSIAGSTKTAGWTYTYDPLLRLTNAASGSSRTYVYDDFGNIASIGGLPIDVSPTTNRLTGTGTAYDGRGNLTKETLAEDAKGDPIWARNSRYDLFNRQVASWSTGSAAPPDTYGFAYDQAGERVLRYRVEGGAVQEARFFIRDEGGNVLSEFLWAPTGLWTRMSDTAYLGRRPLVRMETTPGGDRQYTTLVTDHLGSVRAEIFDATYTEPSYNTMDYWPFGELVSHPATLKSKHLFTAHEREFIGSASGVNTLEGLDYMHARYYSPILGRFTSVDPVGGSVGSSQSFNRYAYAIDNPVNRVDPDGKLSLNKYLARKAARDSAAADFWEEIKRFVRGVAPMNYQPNVVYMEGEIKPTVAEDSDVVRLIKAVQTIRGVADLLIGEKIDRQEERRGWTDEDIRETVENPKSVEPTVDHRHRRDGGQNDDPATRYYSRRGGFVVVNDRTGDIVQVSDRNRDDFVPER